ncbi:MAG TPA: peptidoglycan DD-metalloendopeptidase family protein [Hyphomonadaceae bacterium]|nr:peptidoglycan DD-metalloendopeptidase family protein [Hyphomonadaceae bacterium]
MTILTWLVSTSLAWGAVLCFAGWVLQRSNVSGAARQWIWRCAAILLVAPWLATPLVFAFGWGLAPAPVTPTLLPIDDIPAGGAEISSDLSAPVSVTSNSSLSLSDTLLVIIAGGWIVRFVLAQLAMRQLGGILANSEPAEQGVARSALGAWTHRLGLRRSPQLRIVADKLSPFSFGILRPVICLPEGMERRLDTPSLDLVIGHECMHVRRGDGWLRPLERVFADVFWFNPFAWLIRREIDFARELACDEAVVRITSAERAYARTLRNVAGMTVGLLSSTPAASMSLAGGSRALVKRVGHTLQLAKRKPARAALIAAALLGLIGAPIAVAQVAFAIPAPEAPPAPPAPPAPLPPTAPLAPPAPPTPDFAPIPQPPPTPPAPPAPKAGDIIRSWFPGIVEEVTSTPDGFQVFMSQTADVKGQHGCTMRLTGMARANVKQGQKVSKGDALATAGRRSSTDISCAFNQASNDLAGKPGYHGYSYSYGDVPAPPAPPALPTPKAFAAPPAPAAPPAWPAPEARPTPRAFAAPAAPAIPVVPAAPAAPTATPEAIPPLTPGVAPTPPQPPKVLRIPASGGAIYGFGLDPNGKTLDMSQDLNLVSITGVELRAGFSGKVTFAGKQGNRGRTVEILKDDGQAYRFSYLDSISVKQGDTIHPGDVIGRTTAGPTVDARLLNPSRTTQAIPHYEIAPLRAQPLTGATVAVVPAQVIVPAPTGAAPTIRGDTSPVIAAPVVVTSAYGPRIDPISKKQGFHDGIDLAAALGTPVQSPHSGLIIFAGEKDNLGKVVEIDLGDGQAVRFAHLDEIRVVKDDKVKAGDVVGTVGTDANSTGPHLHLEFYQNGQKYDPAQVKGITFFDLHHS